MLLRGSVFLTGIRSGAHKQFFVKGNFEFVFPCDRYLQGLQHVVVLPVLCEGQFEFVFPYDRYLQGLQHVVVLQ